jgi:hypothetical protein
LRGSLNSNSAPDGYRPGSYTNYSAYRHCHSNTGNGYTSTYTNTCANRYANTTNFNTETYSYANTNPNAFAANCDSKCSGNPGRPGCCYSGSPTKGYS